MFPVSHSLIDLFARNFQLGRVHELQCVHKMNSLFSFSATEPLCCCRNAQKRFRQRQKASGPALPYLVLGKTTGWRQAQRMLGSCKLSVSGKLQPVDLGDCQWDNKAFEPSSAGFWQSGSKNKNHAPLGTLRLSDYQRSCCVSGAPQPSTSNLKKLSHCGVSMGGWAPHGAQACGEA